MFCSCCSGLDYSNCCKPYHEGTPAPTALALMRSRYSAYALGKSQYIIETTHPDNPQYEHNHLDWEKKIRAFSESTQFTKLVIDGYGEDWVVFSAHMVQNGQPTLLKEKSKFAKQNGKWLYLSGIIS